MKIYFSACGYAYTFLSYVNFLKRKQQATLTAFLFSKKELLYMLKTLAEILNDWINSQMTKTMEY